MDGDLVRIYEVIGDDVVLAVAGCRLCGEVWLAQAYVPTLHALECPGCHEQDSLALDAFPSLQTCLEAYTGFPRLRMTH